MKNIVKLKYGEYGLECDCGMRSTITRKGYNYCGKCFKVYKRDFIEKQLKLLKTLENK